MRLLLLVIWATALAQSQQFNMKNVVVISVSPKFIQFILIQSTSIIIYVLYNMDQTAPKTMLLFCFPSFVLFLLKDEEKGNLFLFLSIALSLSLSLSLFAHKLQALRSHVKEKWHQYEPSNFSVHFVSIIKSGEMTGAKTQFLLVFNGMAWHHIDFTRMPSRIFMLQLKLSSYKSHLVAFRSFSLPLSHTFILLAEQHTGSECVGCIGLSCTFLTSHERYERITLWAKHKKKKFQIKSIKKSETVRSLSEP